MENSSKRYTYREVKQMVERQKEKYGWEFLFLGANIDAEAERFGIRRDRAVNYNCDSVGTAVNYKALSKAISNVRNCESAERMDEALCEWDSEIRVDYKSRK